LKMEFRVNNQDYPFSVKIDTPYSHRDVMALFRTQYEGTEFDLTQGALAGPFGNPFLVEGGPKFGQTARGVSISRTLYSIMVQSGPNSQIAWYAQDTPCTSVYVPLFSNTSGVSKPFSTGHNQEFSRDSASWAFNFVSNYMQLNYRTISRDEVYPTIEKLQDEIDKQVEDIAARADVTRLEQLQLTLQERVVASWWKLSDFIVMKYNDGKTNWPKAGKSFGYPEQWAEMIGFSNDVHPLWVQPAITPPVQIDGYVEQSVSLPVTWNGKTATWLYDTEVQTAAMQNTQSPFWVQMTLASLAVCVGVVIGRVVERRKVAAFDAYRLLS